MATVLVLGVGGVLGEAWMWGYLGGAQQATGEDSRRARQLVGTSAGSIVAARLAGGEDPRRGEERVRWDGEAEPERRPGALRAAVERATRISMGAFSPLRRPPSRPPRRGERWPGPPCSPGCPPAGSSCATSARALTRSARPSATAG